MKIDHVEDIIRDSFGCWISVLFSAISGWNPGLAFPDHKEAFFFLIETLLDRGVIRFSVPSEMWKEGDDIWEADFQSILSYLKSRWPPAATSEDDTVLVDYFYDIPAVLWIADDGSIHSS